MSSKKNQIYSPVEYCAIRSCLKCIVVLVISHLLYMAVLSDNPVLANH